MAYFWDFSDSISGREGRNKPLVRVIIHCFRICLNCERRCPVGRYQSGRQGSLCRIQGLCWSYVIFLKLILTSFCRAKELWQNHMIREEKKDGTIKCNKRKFSYEYRFCGGNDTHDPENR